MLKIKSYNNTTYIHLVCQNVHGTCLRTHWSVLLSTDAKTLIWQWLPVVDDTVYCLLLSFISMSSSFTFPSVLHYLKCCLNTCSQARKAACCTCIWLGRCFTFCPRATREYVNLWQAVSLLEGQVTWLCHTGTPSALSSLSNTQAYTLVISKNKPYSQCCLVNEN